MYIVTAFESGTANFAVIDPGLTPEQMIAARLAGTHVTDGEAVLTLVPIGDLPTEEGVTKVAAAVTDMESGVFAHTPYHDPATSVAELFEQ